ncbi:MAG TPA: hypothetical protein VN685_02675, partial [Rhizomicrobium sp.]|nr:hypothetical protein [Rhizomicrobium sp.]
AVDINRVNGKKANDPDNRDAVKNLQKAFGSEPNSRENFGPTGSTKRTTPGGPPLDWSKKIEKDGKTIGEHHKDHLHESGQG